jgi:predicted nucleic acid-binding protein
VKALVVDASVAVKWAVPEPFTEQATTLLEDHDLYAPAHWQAEAVNAVWKRVHRRQLTMVDAKECVSLFVDAPVNPVPLTELLEAAMEFAARLRISIYDALYVALAADRQIPLVSDDRELLRRMMAEPTLGGLSLPVTELARRG